MRRLSRIASVFWFRFGNISIVRNFDRFFNKKCGLAIVRSRPLNL